MFGGSLLERFHSLGGCAVGPMNAACFDIRQPLSYSVTYKRLRREGDFPTLNSSFQEIAYVQTDLLAHILRDDDLILALDGDECHVLVLLNRSSAASFLAISDSLWSPQTRSLPLDLLWPRPG
jgi:hypothetical protein